MSDTVTYSPPAQDVQAHKPAIVTPGDPAGIGPEISLRAWQAGRKNIVLQGDIDHLGRIADALGLAISFTEYDAASFARTHRATCHVIHDKWATDPIFGSPDPAHARQIITAIEKAVRHAKDQLFSAIVTNPIAKNNLYQAGFSYPGHTEFLAHLDGGEKQPVMMLANPQLRVIPLTVHIPLNEVESAITEADLAQTISILASALRRYFGIAHPHISIAGLNPHAGESGFLGRFEIDRIIPFLADFSIENLQLSGPHSADSLFHEEARKNYDAVLCMYHDQALIPIKTIDFFNSVNVTLGLDFIRTSPDHGTAFNRAGNLDARPDSLIAAIDMAAEMARHADGK